MRSFTVHEPPIPAADRMDRAEALVFVKDGFSWSALLFAPIWLLVHRLWWPLLGYLVLSGAFELVRLAGTGLDPRWLSLAVFGLHLFIAFEADALRRWGLTRRGWRMLGSVTARNIADAERRFFEAWLPSQPVIAPSGGTSPLVGPPRPRTPVIGSLLGARA